MSAARQAPLITLDSRVRDVWAHPLGQDVVRKILLQLGRSTRWVDNPLVGSLTLRTLQRLAGERLDAGFFDALQEVLNTNRDIPSDTAVEVAYAAAGGTIDWQAIKTKAMQIK